MTSPQLSLPSPVCSYCGPDCLVGYGYCHDGCGQKTNIIPESCASRGFKKGLPFARLRGHSGEPRILPEGMCICGVMHCPVPFGYCHCYCGLKTTISKWNNAKCGWIARMPILFIDGHGGNMKIMETTLANRPPIRFAEFNGKIRAFVPVGLNQEMKIDLESLPLVEGKVFTLGGNKYARCRISLNVEISAHKLIGGPDAVDHRDGDTFNNCLENIRPATFTQNMWNRKKHSNNTSGYKGVHFKKKQPLHPWEARINVNKKRIHLGNFVTREEAARRYDLAAVECFGDFARLNFPDEIELRRAELLATRNAIHQAEWS
jgi:hypothetical protein